MASTLDKSTFTRRGAKGHLVLTGRLTADTAEETLEVARRAGSAKTSELRVELQDVERIDVTTVQILLALKETCAQTEREFSIDASDAKVAEVLKMGGLS